MFNTLPKLVSKTTGSSHSKYVAMQTERVTKYVQSLDPSRLYNPASGWVDANVGDLIDMHKYVGPGALYPTSTRASVLGEFGGLGLKVDQHQWIPEDSFSYEMQVSDCAVVLLNACCIDSIRPMPYRVLPLLHLMSGCMHSLQ